MRILTVVAAGAASLLPFAFPFAATAQDIRQTVTVTATASPVPFENLARTVVVLTRDQIASLPVTSVAELLQYAASVDVRSRGAFGVQSDVAIRGASFGQTLVLVDGVRLNDSQSSHHNADIPVLPAEIDRIEILYGPGSSLYGADAFGGTINVVTRAQAAPQGEISGGSDGFADARAAAGVARGATTASFDAGLTRSSGFMPDREFRIVNLSSRMAVGTHTSLTVRHQDKDFGANGFYGVSPSKEWTTQTLVAVEARLRAGKPWQATTSGWYRTHGDHFLWDIARPGFAENRHRTHAVGANVRVRRALTERRTVTFGGEAGGDWIRSNNLGDHAVARGGLFAELQQRLGRTALVYPSIRYDRYEDFGGAWSPTIAASTWLGRAVKIRSSLGRAFRVPTFTELYYRDPNNRGTATLTPEHAWSGEGGVDWVAGGGWIAGATVFQRSEHDVIDWIRPTAQVPWDAANLRAVTTRGAEAGLRRTFGAGRFLDGQYTYIASDAGAVSFLSKYVLDYARHAVTVSASVPLPLSLTIGTRAGYKRRVDSTAYGTIDARVTRPFGRMSLFVEATNLGDEQYQEIRGVDMPGRSFRAGLRVGSD